MNDIDISALTCIVFSGNTGKLRGYAKRFFRIVHKSALCGNRHTAFADTEVQKLVNVGTVFQQNILARNADIRRASLHVDRNVGGLDPEVANALLLVFKGQLAVIFFDGGAFVARRLQHGVNLFAKSALGQGDVNHLLQGSRSLRF